MCIDLQHVSGKTSDKYVTRACWVLTVSQRSSLPHLLCLMVNPSASMSLFFLDVYVMPPL